MVCESKHDLFDFYNSILFHSPSRLATTLSVHMLPKLRCCLIQILCVCFSTLENRLLHTSTSSKRCTSLEYYLFQYPVISFSSVQIPIYLIIHISVQFSSVTQSCPTLYNPMNCSMPGLPVHHQLLEFTQTHAHRVSDAIQPPHPFCC